MRYMGRTVVLGVLGAVALLLAMGACSSGKSEVVDSGAAVADAVGDGRGPTEDGGGVLDGVSADAAEPSDVPRPPPDGRAEDISADVAGTTDLPEDACQAHCAGKECGPDGCGGSCGECTGGSNAFCTNEGLCACSPDSCEGLGYDCGEWDDGCGAMLVCGACDGWPNSACVEGSCTCTPDCSGKSCGGDGCGGSCGECVCGNGLCEDTESAGGCPEDCGPCGDGICGVHEEGVSGSGEPVCWKDCGPACGDGVCEDGEDNAGCPYDCPACGDGVCAPGEDQAGGCVFDCSPMCGDGVCGGFFETPASCPQDCPAECGDGICLPPETVADCPGDCGWCGDGVCGEDEDLENCAADCVGQCGNGICEGSESPAGCPVDCGSCGDGVCGLLEGPESCAADCGAACGDGVCDDGESESTCPEDCACLPDCSNQDCGLDDCGFDCGSCPEYAECGEDKLCHCQFLECGESCCGAEAVCSESGCCVPDCSGKSCGGDGCGGSCGECGELEVCQGGSCTCEFVGCGEVCCGAAEVCFSGSCCLPECEGKECGDDKCGGSCGECGFATECEAGICVWQVFCGNGACEPEAGEDCETCPADCGCGNNAVCLEGGTCCDLQCAGKECGPDGCGGTCGECAAFSTCSAEGLCECDYVACGNGCCGQAEVCHNGSCCAPSCEGKQCGDDGCGGSCGECDEGFVCEANLCQCDNVIWTRNLGDDDQDRIYDVSLAPEGYYFGGRMEELLDYHDFWVGMVNESGYLQWQNDYTGSGNFSKDIAFGVATTPEGDVVAVGKKDTGLWYSGWARKVGPDGTSVWGKTFGGNGLNEFRDVVVSNSGTYVTVGQVFSGYTYKGWLVELSASGSSVNSKTFTASGAFDVFRGIEKVSTGGYIVVGTSGLQSIDNEDYVSPGQMWLVRLNDSLGQVWSKKVSSSSEGFAVAETPDGFIVVGYVWNGSNRDIRVVRTDSEGNKLWEQTYGWGKDDVARAVAVRPSGNYLVTGYAAPEGQTDQDLFIMELTGAGAILWQNYLGNSSTQGGFSLLPLPEEPNKYLIGGRNGNDGWLVKITTCY